MAHWGWSRRWGMIELAQPLLQTDAQARDQQGQAFTCNSIRRAMPADVFPRWRVGLVFDNPATVNPAFHGPQFRRQKKRQSQRPDDLHEPPGAAPVRDPR